MPRQVDHAERRRRIADAVCELADERGLEGVTLRDVAARAEVSMGAVQRCFRTKEEMLVFALGHIGERIGARVRARLVRSPAQSAGTALGHAATEVALLREEHRAEARVWLAFVAQAAVSEVLARTVQANYAVLQESFARLIEEACADTGAAAGARADTGRAAPLDPRREARALLALADGLTTHVLIGHLTPREAEDVLHTHLARLLPQ
ncbi:TetR family transcriptional regulator C-terminal domain-containing protein (plasmid) [Streptomyces goshikiensis]|uniref:TetR family transcriptional regulator C-terminal domain-containing protein n=1 Tax=Streptomyces goshikiensis TaxID=1942 RepID=A0ABZ1RYQ8_9ACTN|nr:MULTISPECIES: TetR/AcrR family transcriptional regulator [Streptomyces]MBP0932193.1 TetR/AcrR family transcriptional regulator [Streptomyces sp. KCTC 0041BP]PJN17744.1 TetR family transcriptional regulator [Streptomyces sp. CB02120-2]